MFAEFQIVRLTHECLCDLHSTPVPMGTVGTIVDMVNLGGALRFIVEFQNPHTCIVSVREESIIHAEAPLKVLVTTEKRPNPYWSTLISISVWPGAGPIVEATCAVIDAWCAEHWPNRDTWERENTQIIVSDPNMAVEFRLRWHGVGIDGMFERV